MINYIGHSQWEGHKFSSFVDKVINGTYDKIILCSQIEWDWHRQTEEVMIKLEDHCKKIGQPLHVICCASEYLYPYTIENTIVHHWDTYWFIKTYGGIMRAHHGTNVFIDVNNPPDYKYHYVSMNRMPKYHRALLIDLLARDDMFKYGAVSVHNEPDQTNPYNYIWRWFNFKPMLLEENFKDQFSPPEQYYESFAQLVSETSATCICISEKTVTPLMLGKPFLVSGIHHFHKYLRKLGFELFEEIFDYSFDEELDVVKRNEMIVDNFKRLTKIPLFQLKDLQKKIAPKLLHNRERVKEIIFDFNSYPKIAQEIIEHHKLTNQSVDEIMLRDYYSILNYKDIS